MHHRYIYNASYYTDDRIQYTSMHLAFIGYLEIWLPATKTTAALREKGSKR